MTVVLKTTVRPAAVGVFDPFSNVSPLRFCSSYGRRFELLV